MGVKQFSISKFQNGVGELQGCKNPSKKNKLVEKHQKQEKVNQNISNASTNESQNSNEDNISLPEENYKSIIIFDWDDTLLCTSYLTPTGKFEEDIHIPQNDLQKIKILEQCTYNILSYAIEKAEVFIVTNASPGWVEYSCIKFMPSVSSLLGQLKIISARGLFSQEHPNDSRMWKIQTFLELRKCYDDAMPANLICLGDSPHEMEAALKLASKFDNSYLKTVKFQQNPKIEDLIKQLNLVYRQFNFIISTIKNLSVKIERKKYNKQ